MKGEEPPLQEVFFGLISPCPFLPPSAGWGAKMAGLEVAWKVVTVGLAATQEDRPDGMVVTWEVGTAGLSAGKGTTTANFSVGWGVEVAAPITPAVVGATSLIVGG